VHQKKNASFRVFVYCPAGLEALAVAASRAGGVGILAVDGRIDTAEIAASLARLGETDRGTRGAFGLRVPYLDHDVFQLIDKWAPSGLSYVIVPQVALETCDFRVAPGIAEKVAVFAEVTGRTESPCFSRVDGLVIKGNEAPGRVGEESSFILFQHWISRTDLPIIIHGGVTPQVAAAIAAMGGAGGVVDSQLYLMPNAGLASPIADLLRSLSGTETVLLGDPTKGQYLRILQHPRAKAAARVLAQHQLSPISEIEASLDTGRIGLSDPECELFALGHDIALAATYADAYKTVAGFLGAVNEAVAKLPKMAAKQASLMRGNSFARAFGVDVPVIQGPMTRVSDNARFAAAVAAGGALPTIALATMRPEQVREVIVETKTLLSGHKWGVGFLGFLPQELFRAQLDVVLVEKPDFAIIAGGRPDQIAQLEGMGVPTFLHLPSAKLLNYYLKNGSRRLIFEGRECGGHVGPTSSFVLWSAMVDRICAEIDADRIKGSELDCVFAGGLHDAFSSACLQVLVAPLAARGVRLGMIVGTAYILTKEITESGAITPLFQQVVREGRETAILASGPGHASRSMRTPFVDKFIDRQKALRGATEMPEEDKREVLDDMIMGTLRVASKGVQRSRETGEIEAVDDATQLETGMYMIGQVASLRDDVRSINELHNSLTDEAVQLLADRTREVAPAVQVSLPLDIAIVGMSVALPGAMSTAAYWQNILGRVDSVAEIPRHRWDWRLYFDEDRKAKDKIYSRWGGFLEDMPFEPGDFGITPKSLLSIDPMQLMALKVADEALRDAGHKDMSKDLRDHTAVIIGASGGAGDVGLQYNLRSEVPRFEGSLHGDLAARLPEWSEDTFAGILINVISGRIANRLDLGGPNYTTDAACASSLAAVYQACNELRAGRSRMAIAGGVDTQQSPFGFMCFSQTQALSPRGRSRSFDKGADGIAISEGIVMVVLRPLEDAEAQGDRIYAIIKGIGSSSDGKGKALSAPEAEGQWRAMRRAYNQAGYTSADVQLFEAHGTGTVVGDITELTSTGNLVTETNPMPRSAVIGSVKTNIGHTKATAGIAGLAKVALALHHKVLPPHRGVDDPVDVLAAEKAPLYLLDAAEPWVLTGNEVRRGSVSAFGFGGTNFHATLEEYRGEYRSVYQDVPTRDWPAELLVFSGSDRAALCRAVEAALSVVLDAPALKPRLLAAALARSFKSSDGSRAALVVTDLESAVSRLEALAAHLRAGTKIPVGVTVSQGAAEGKVAVLFPGQGSQYLNMGRESAVYLPELRTTFSRANAALHESLSGRYGRNRVLTSFIFPRGIYDKKAEAAARVALTSTDIAQPALGALEAGLWAFLAGRLKLRGDMFAGHSYGEFVAHHAAGVLSFGDLMTVSAARGRLIVEKVAEARSELGTMLALMGTREQAEALAANIDGLVVANHNSPSQVILSGPEAAVDACEKAAQAQGLRVSRLPVAAAFHSQQMAPARDALGAVIEHLDWDTDSIGLVYSNERAAPHGADVRAAMIDHLVKPVEFVKQIRAMYAAGARTFVEVGPKTVLSKLVGQILDDPSVRTVTTDGEEGGIADLLSAIGALAVGGHPLAIQRLFDGRDCADVKMADLARIGQPVAPSKRGWWINGSGVRRAEDPVRTVGLTLENAEALKTASARTITPVWDAPSPTHSPSAPVFDVPPQAVSGAEVTALVYPQSSPNHIFSRGDRMYDAPIRPGPDKPASSVSTEFFDLMKRVIEGAEAVARAELGASQALGGARLGHKQVPLRPAPETPAVFAKPAVAALGLSEAQTRFAHAPRDPVSAEARAPVPTAAPTALGKGPAPASSSESARAPALAANVDLKAILLAIVSDKTGYDEDILEMNISIEADLGIDSIKRVDVVAGLIEALPGAIVAKLGDSERSALIRAKSLDGMLEVLTTAEGSANFNLAGADTGLDRLNAPEARTVDFLPRPDQARHTVTPRREPLPANILSHLTEGDILVTPSGRSLDKTLALALTAAGRTVHLLPVEALADETALVAWVYAQKSRLGRLGGVVHLAALGAAPIDLSSDRATWLRQLFLAEKSAYILLRDLDFVPHAHAVAVTSLGGTFARSGADQSALRLEGGAVGLLKSLLREDETRRCKAIDLDLGISPEAQAAIILAEMAAVGGRVEVGYPQGNRTVFRTELAPIRPDAAEAAPAGEIILATGGARGITAETIRELGAPGVTFVLTGRSPRPAPEDAMRDDPTLATLDATGLAKHFVRALKLPIAEARRRAGKVVAAREMADCLAALEETGAAVEYLSVDVNRPADVRAAVADIYLRHGRLDGIVHGAGVIEDKLLRDMPGDGWDRVVETKVVGLLSLMAAVHTEGLKFFHVFTSVAGRYGNSGQTSYATANELMARICSQWQAMLSAEVRVKAMSWGPWGPTTFGAGMVTPETERKFRAQNVHLVHARLGADLFRMETRCDVSSDGVEVVFGAAPWEAAEAGRSRLILDADAGLLGDAKAIAGAGGKQILPIKIDTAVPYLQDHVIEGNAVLPMAVALEMMAGSVARTFGAGLKVAAIEDARLFHGIVLSSETRVFHLVMSQNSHGMGTEESVTVKLFSADNATRPHYAARIVLTRDLASAPALMPMLPPAEARSLSQAEVYEDHLFHGPAFQAVLHANAVWSDGALVTTRSSQPFELLGDAGGPDWVFDPFVIDGIAQLPLLWAHALTGRFALPISFGSIVRHADSLATAASIELSVTDDRPDMIVADAVVRDHAGSILLTVKGMTHGVRQVTATRAVAPSVVAV
jgi:acyl transferase domain-containing protein/NAD(P)H-dependent flavin oxidoreductase YrpB (nitropropane dioxygenase family)/NAD(P)-dependent dehydrogenase (short-subunit alcohol dehydrogenase family)